MATARTATTHSTSNNMQPGFDPLVIGQIALGAIADLAFAMAVGAAWLGFDFTRTRRVIRVALCAWLVAQMLYLPLQAATMSGVALADAWPVMPVVLLHAHFGMMWLIGIAAGIVAL